RGSGRCRLPAVRVGGTRANQRLQQTAAAMLPLRDPRLSARPPLLSASFGGFGYAASILLFAGQPPLPRLIEEERCDASMGVQNHRVWDRRESRVLSPVLGGLLPSSLWTERACPLDRRHPPAKAPT